MKKVVKKRSGMFRECFSYVLRLRNYILLSIGLFVFAALIAFAFPESFSFFDAWLREIVLKVKDLGPFPLILFIFQNNVTSAFFSMIFGIAFGVFPVLNAVTNGAVLGYVLAKASAIEGGSTIFRLIPHGIFELPAIFLAMAMGMRLGMFFFRHDKHESLGDRIILSLKVFLCIIVPLLVIAAIIEGLLISFS